VKNIQKSTLNHEGKNALISRGTFFEVMYVLIMFFEKTKISNAQNIIKTVFEKREGFFTDIYVRGSVAISANKSEVIAKISCIANVDIISLSLVKIFLNDLSSSFTKREITIRRTT
jgi:hypothetical protein